MSAVVDTAFSIERLRALHDMANRAVFWRHDVDFDLGCAVRMARLEAGEGIRSTFFLRVDGEEYSLREAWVAARRLASYGHFVGVHVNLRLSRDAEVPGALLAVQCADDFRKLKRRFPECTQRVSLHAPPGAALWREIFGFDHAMAPWWKGFYLGDSRGVFRQSPEEFLLVDRPVQLNLHPEWWFLPEAEAQKLREQEALKP